MDTRQNEAARGVVSDRTPRPLLAPLLAFDLPREAEILREEATWQANHHNARTLIKHSEFRLVLMVLQAGTSIEPQSIHQRICIQTLRGKLQLQVADGNVELGKGGLAAIDEDVTFGIVAYESSELLLWIGWSGT